MWAWGSAFIGVDGGDLGFQSHSSLMNLKHMMGFPGGTVVKNPPANAGDTGSSPGPGKSHMPRSN